MLHGRILTKTVFGSLRSIWAPSSLNYVSSSQRQWFSASSECFISFVHSVTPLEYVALVCLPPSKCSWADMPRAKTTEWLAFGLFCSCLWQFLVAFLIGQFPPLFFTLLLISRYVSLAFFFPLPPPPFLSPPPPVSPFLTAFSLTCVYNLGHIP